MATRGLTLLSGEISRKIQQQIFLRLSEFEKNNRERIPSSKNKIWLVESTRKTFDGMLVDPGIPLVGRSGLVWGLSRPLYNHETAHCWDVKEWRRRRYSTNILPTLAQNKGQTTYERSRPNKFYDIIYCVEFCWHWIFVIHILSSSLVSARMGKRISQDKIPEFTGYMWWPFHPVRPCL